jgi:RecB family exonuclease
MLPGIEEVRFDGSIATPPSLHCPSAEAVVYSARDREEEAALFARRVKDLARRGEAASLDRIALVVNQPLPYVYVAPEVLQSGGVPCQALASLPLAAEPYAAALDLVLSCVTTAFGRAAVLALLQSPQFQFGPPAASPLLPREVAAVNDIVPAGGCPGDGGLDRLLDASHEAETVPGAGVEAVAAARALRQVVSELRPLASDAPAADHLAAVLAFVTTHERQAVSDQRSHERHQRARAAILGTIAELRDAYARFDSTPVAFDDVAALLRRWIDGQTCAPGADRGGVHVVDAASAPFGRFDHVHLAGLVDGEWPQRQRRSIFYSAAILRDLGWPPESLRIDGARAAFGDLLTVASATVAASTFLLEDDALVTPSPLVDGIEQVALERIARPVPDVRIFEYEALGLDDVAPAPRPGPAASAPAPIGDAAPGGRPYAVSALERYQDCPFRFFATDVLRLPEPDRDDDVLSPRAHGRFVHEVLQRFFEAWDAQTDRAPIDVTRLDEARALCAVVAGPLLARLNEADAALERARLFGSAISIGIVDVVLGVEAASAGDVRDRWLEHEFDGAFTLGSGGRRVRLKGIVDRVDLLAGNRLRVIDYKTGAAPDSRRALQAAVYALCLQEELTTRDRSPWTIAEAAYVAFAGRRAFASAVAGGGTAGAGELDAARSRVFAVMDGIARAEFPPRPHDPLLCRSCAYPSVCRHA